VIAGLASPLRPQGRRSAVSRAARTRGMVQRRAPQRHTLSFEANIGAEIGVQATVRSFGSTVNFGATPQKQPPLPPDHHERPLKPKLGVED
jgi:hypothetical protein